MWSRFCLSKSFQRKRYLRNGDASHSQPEKRAKLVLQQLLMSLFICIYVLEPCNDNEEDCPLKAAKGDCWKTAEPSSITEKLCDPDRTFPLWVTCKKSCRRCNGKGWKTKRVQQLNICRYSYACYKHDDNDLFSGLLNYQCTNLSAPGRSNPVLLVRKFKVESYKL